MAEKILGDSRVQQNYRITLTTEVRKKLKIRVGDKVAYVEDDKGNIVLRRAELKTV